MTNAQRNRGWAGLIVAGVLMTLPAATATSAQTNPVPLINDPLVPGSAVPGGKSFTLTVNGTGFANGASVLWNGTALVTVVNSASKLTATVPASKIATAGAGYVSVTNPGASQASNLVMFPIVQPSSSVGFAGSTVATLNTPMLVGLGDFKAGNLDIALIDYYGDIEGFWGSVTGHFPGR
jgi:hypothetical protein